MRKHVYFPVLLPAAVALGGCSTPFAGSSTDLTWGAPTRGTITISDPKMYRREALLNEQQQEVAWIDTLLEASKTIDFKPEMVRETEQITAFAASLGLSFDPAAGRSFKRNQETGEIQQQIDVMKLQLQLDQLKRDAELIRAKLPDQAAAVNDGVNKLPAAGTAAAAATPAATASAIDELKAAIATLTTSMTNRLDADGKPAALANATVNPADLFRDRVAYRDLLKAARNAASRDELHDSGGATLMRLNFQATILPGAPDAAAPGVIQMEIVGPGDLMDETPLQKSYKGWLAYLNSTLNGWPGERPVLDTSLLREALLNNFDTVEYRFAPKVEPTPAAPSTPPKGKAKGKVKATPRAAAVAKPVVCPGLVVGSIDTTAGCESLKFVVPWFVGTTSAEGASSRLAKYYRIFKVDADDGGLDERDFQRARDALEATKDLVVACTLNPSYDDGNDPTVLKLRESVDRLVAGEILIDIDRRARAFLTAHRTSPPVEPKMEEIERRTQRAQLLLETYEQFRFAGCSDDARYALRRQGARIAIPPRFMELMRDNKRISIYDVGPREQVQQVSSVARVANNLSLAVSIAASDPSSGAAANAAAGYQKQAMGRAAALERVPAVVGYSLVNTHKFGWVIGPKMTLNPKGEMKLDQTLRTYDLSVELAVPAWWPYFTLKTLTSWAPDPGMVSQGGLIAPPPLPPPPDARPPVTVGKDLVAAGAVPEKGQGLPTPTAQADPRLPAVAALSPTRIPMMQTPGNYAALTSQMAAGDLEPTRNAWLSDPELTGQSVNACRTATLLLKGDNVWRTSVAIIGGAKMPATAISVSPSMDGILLEVAPLDAALGDTVVGAKVPIRLLTPYGAADGSVDYVRKPDSGCAPPPKVDGATLASVTPLDIVVPQDQTFTVLGAKLTQVTKVTLNGQPVTIVTATEKSMTVGVKSAETGNIPTSNTVPLTFFKDDAKVAEILVRATRIEPAKP